MRFTKILCPTDFSEGSRQAVRVATRIANETGAELVLAHAWHIPALAFSADSPLPAEMIQDTLDDAQRALDAAVREATSAGAKRVAGTMLTGIPVHEIVSLLEKQAFDLCVIGTHGRTGLSRILLGSVAENIIRHTPCSILAVRPDSTVEPFAHALVPTDFSECAEYALHLAADVVRPGGTIKLLHVIDIPVRFSGEIVADLARDIDKRAAVALETSAARVKTASVVTESRIGYPGAQTLAAIEDDRDIDLVVMGSHGRTGIKRMFLGSVAEKVVRHARCSVLVARRRQR